MQIKKVLAYFKARKEQKNHNWRPPYYPGDGTVEDRRESLVKKRIEEFETATITYHKNENPQIDQYLDALWQRVQDARAIVTYEDWECELMREDLKLPHTKRKNILAKFFHHKGAFNKHKG